LSPADAFDDTCVRRRGSLRVCHQGAIPTQNPAR
jgi:hypothetical protein